MTSGKKVESAAAIDLTKVKNKQMRQDLFHQQKHAKNVAKLKRRLAARKEEEEGGAPEKAIPITIERVREYDETVVQNDDFEVLADEGCDEFAEYFAGSSDVSAPKVAITTSKRATREAYQFANELASVIPGAEVRTRLPTFEIKDIVKEAIEKGYTDLLVINEDKKTVHGLLICHLPKGPTAYFRVRSYVPSKKIYNHGRSTEHFPELILNQFSTRLGHSIGRLFASLFPQNPQFKGRQVVTFHNQRDFIFFRRHRYIFKEKEESSSSSSSSSKKKKEKEGAGDDEDDLEKRVRTSLQEIGPRFTLRLQWLQKGTYDPVFGEYEWKYKKENDVSRRKFFL